MIGKAFEYKDLDDCEDDEAREERAAIMEFDGGLSREEAEENAGLK